MRICIIGAGAIGSVVAGVLSREGYNITLVVKHADLAEKISGKGIERGRTAHPHDRRNRGRQKKNHSC